MTWQRFSTALIGCLLCAAVASAQLVELDFNGLALGDLTGQGGGSGWDAADTFMGNNDNLLDVVSGDLAPPAFTNYAIPQSGTGQHLFGAGGAVNFSRGLATPTGADDTIWFSFIAGLGDLDGSGASNGRTGLIFDSTASNTGRFLMRGLTGTGAGDPNIADMEIFREGGSVDYDLDLNPFLVLGRLSLSSAGNDEISWWYNPDVTAIDPSSPDDSFAGRDWDGGDGLDRMGFTLYGSDEVTLDAFRLSSGTNAYMDVTGVMEPVSTVYEWAVDDSGSANVATNWDRGEVPPAGSDWRMGAVITEARTVTVDSPLEANAITFASNSVYTIDGPSTLTLSGDATISVGSGSASIAATLAGTSGLVKTGGGTLFMSGDNTYTGLTDLQNGLIRVTNANSINGDVNVAGGTVFVFQGLFDENGERTGNGYSGVFSGDITGTGQVAVSDSLSTEVVTFDSAKSYEGLTSINGGTLEISDGGALGVGGTVESRTRVATSAANSGKLRVTGNITVADELLRLEGRDRDDPIAHVESDGNNTWGGTVELGPENDNFYTIESTSGTLSITGAIREREDAGNLEQSPLTLRVGGAGNGDISSIVDVDGLTALEGNINLEKYGAGTWNISTASTDATLFHQGTTRVREGTLSVSSDGANNGELRSSSIHVDAGATFDGSDFGTYNMQVGQDLSGGGTVSVNTLGTFNDGGISPGDNGIGTLTVDGNMTYGAFATTAPRPISVELGSTTAIGGANNDLVDVTGSLTLSGSDTGTVNVTPVQGSLANGAYTIMRASNVSGNAGTLLTPQITARDGTVLTTRQSVSISNTATAVNLNVNGSAANLVWQGGVNGNWDVNATSNWQNGGGSDVFVDLDQTTFDDSASTQNVNVTQSVYPGQIDMNQSGTYQFTGGGSVNALGNINVNSGVTALATANNSATAVNIASGATFQAGSSSGNLETRLSGNVVATSGSVLRIGDEGFSGTPPVTSSEDFESFATGVVFQNNQTEPGSPLTGWQLVDGRSSTSTQPGEDDVVMELNTTPVTGVALIQTNANTDFPNTGQAHNGSMAISPLDSSGAIDTVTATIGQDDPSGGFADASIVFGYVDQDNYFYAQVTQGQGINIQQVVEDSRSTLAASGNGIGGFANNTPWDVTLVHNASAGTATFTVSDGTNTQSISVSDAILQQDGLIGVGSQNDGWFVDDISVTTEAPSASVFTVDGDLELQAGSILQMDVASTANLDRMIVNGNLDAGGTLELNATSSFMGADGQVYNLLDFTSATGAFSSFDLPTLGDGLVWDTSNILIDGTLAIMMQTGLACDFDGSGMCDLDDIDALVMEVAGATGNLDFDINGDGMLDTGDVQEWLAQAGNENIGAAYLNGDANLDGVVDVSDFGIWNANKFTSTGKWSLADFSADGVTDVSDFGIWNGNKFTSSNDAAAVPEPAAHVMLITVLLAGLLRLRRSMPLCRN